MNQRDSYTYKNVCPRNCPSACTMISEVDHDRVIHITGDRTNPYTGGKLCAKGFSYIEQNYHEDRLKYPYYQKVKGSGKFKQISWEKAYELIINELLKIHERFGTFLPFALYKGFGNIGLHHYVINDFFSCMGETTRITGGASLLHSQQQLEEIKQRNTTDVTTIVNASIIIIWGANPAGSNIHLIPFIIKAKMKGAKIVVIDPLYTQTVGLADLFIQLRPNTDKLLINALIKTLIQSNKYDEAFIEQFTVGFSDFANAYKEMNIEDALEQCDIPQEALDQLFSWLIDAKTVSYIIGTGLHKHADSENNLLAIETLAVVRGDIGKEGGGVFFQFNRMGALNASQEDENQNDRILHINEISHYTSVSNPIPIEMLWISCGNPLVQEINPISFEKFMQDIPFVVTVDRFMTPTARMSNLVLPTTSHFEETDVVMSNWYDSIFLNEKAISPYYESKSDWTIMTQLSLKIKEQSAFSCDFPIYPSEEAYLNAQFNEHTFARFGVRNLDDLKDTFPSTARRDVQDKQGVLEANNYRFDFTNLHLDHRQSIQPTKEYPFWLITPHHPYALNSQFHYLNLSDENEVYVNIHPKIAEKFGIMDGEIVRVFNEQAAIEMKAVYSSRVPKDILMIYQGWYPHSNVTINKLISEWQSVHKGSTSLNHGIAFYDTFVHVEKI